MNMCVPIKKKQTKDTAYIVIRNDNWPIAIFENLEDAEDMAGSYNQDMIDSNVQLTFKVIATAFYPE